MIPDYRRPPFQPPNFKGQPRVVEKEKTAKAVAKEVRQVNAQVDKRDQKRCQCCGRTGNPNATTTLGKIHRAHIVDASKLGPYTPENLCSLCSLCHAYIHAKKLWFAGWKKKRMHFKLAASVAPIVFQRRVPKHVTLLAE